MTVITGPAVSAAAVVAGACLVVPVVLATGGVVLGMAAVMSLAAWSIL